METSNHQRAIRDQFTKQAAAFTAMPEHSQEEAMGLMLRRAMLRPTDTVLDVACGPGLVACAFAEHVASVEGIDITPAMLEQARQLQEKKGLTNLSWRLGDVLPLPYPDGAFTRVVTRYSLHHFLNPGAVVREMVRVCAPGGRVVVVDASPDADKAEAYDRVERLRDPSHTRALPSEELLEAIASSGLVDVTLDHYRLPMELEKLLSASFPERGSAERVRALFEEDLRADTLSMKSHLVDGRIHFSFPVAVLSGSRPA
ncbi:MAG TPA: methyltransferase domain-containing protein [Armatimonadota bacterium]|jgi:ubiquinone/menaquinone biosynthesis C-methylase UbiE